MSLDSYVLFLVTSTSSTLRLTTPQHLYEWTRQYIFVNVCVKKMNERLEQKLFEERIEVCLACKKVMDCGHVAEFEYCVFYCEDYVEA